VNSNGEDAEAYIPRKVWTRQVKGADLSYSGGLEMLFEDKRRHTLSIPAVDKDGKPATVAFLIDYLCRNTMKDSRQELFALDNHL
jgi:ubiquitin related modifier 1